jgi:hypothetical protein
MFFFIGVTWASLIRQEPTVQWAIEARREKMGEGFELSTRGYVASVNTWKTVGPWALERRTSRIPTKKAFSPAPILTDLTGSPAPLSPHGGARGTELWLIASTLAYFLGFWLNSMTQNYFRILGILGHSDHTWLTSSEFWNFGCAEDIAKSCQVNSGMLWVAGSDLITSVLCLCVQTLETFMISLGQDRWVSLSEDSAAGV